MSLANPFPLREKMRGPANQLFGSLGLRLVNAHWGPVGFQEAFRRVAGQELRPAQIVDVGASDGSWTRECLEVFPEADYFLVDPLPANVLALEALARENPKVRYWSGALGEAAGKLPFYVHGDQSSFLPSEFGNGVRAAIEVRTLDSFIGSGLINAPQLIKADVQGYELEVLKGAAKCLEGAELLLLELSYRRIYEGAPLAHEVIAFVAARGFRILDICSYAQRARDGLLAQSDILFAKNNSVLFEQEGWE